MSTGCSTPQRYAFYGGNEKLHTKSSVFVDNSLFLHRRSIAMTPKHYIACWLSAVYLLMTVGPAFASLSCRCMIMDAHTETACCHHHSPVATDEVPEHAEWDAPCCCDRHSTKIVLYTNETNDRTDRIAIPVSAALLPEDIPSTAPEAAFFERVDDRRAHFLCHGSVRCAGLRAPPSQN